MISPEEFIRQWGDDEEPLDRFRQKAVEQLAISEDDRRLLADAGLPESAAPFLMFQSPETDELPTVADQWQQPSAFRRYRIIGSDESGNPVAIDEERSGEVVYLDHDNRFDRVLMNSSVRHLAECLLAFRQMVEETIATNGEDAYLDGNIPAEARSRLEADLHRIDPAAVRPGSFWNRAVADLTP